jgi:cell division protein FtsI (penicillin-binding protein 3)
VKRIERSRLAFTTIVIFAIIILFSARLIDLQVVQGPALSQQASLSRSVTESTQGVRGSIVDDNGVVLADGVDRFDITASPKQILSIPSAGFARTVDGVTTKVKAEDALAEIAKLTGQTAATVQLAIDAQPKSNFTYLAKSVTLAVYTAVMKLDVPGVYAEPDPGREYPDGAVAGNLVGFMGTDGAQAGIELKYNSCLAGTKGSETFQTAADGTPLPGSTVEQSTAEDGGTIKLTIDGDLQYQVQEAIAAQAVTLGAPWATAVVERVSDGHLLAVADYPSVDPNNVNTASRSALGSRAFSTPYEPGSTFKSMSVAALLDAGVITPTTEITVPSVYTTGLPAGSYIKDSEAHGTLHYTTAGVLENSSNIGMSILSESLPAKQRHDYMAAFGLGQKTAVGFTGESGGVLHAAPWDPITNRTVEFGQGVEATSVQVAQIYATLANHGVREPSTLVEGCEHADGTVTDTPTAKPVRVISAKAADETVGMLETVVTGGPMRSLLKFPGYRIAAKTGTAQVQSSTGGGYGDTYIISDAGIAPAENPQYVVVVTFGPQALASSSGAAPAFTKVMDEVLNKYRVPPSTTPAPFVQTTW